MHTSAKMVLLLFCQIFRVQSWFNRSVYNERYGVTVSEEVERVMNRVDRANYISARCRRPYYDKYQRIGCGSAISAPHLHAWILEFFKDHLVGAKKALDIGSGSGYMTAAMAVMMGPTSRVIGIDHIRQLVEKATENVRRDNEKLLTSGRVKFLGDARNGYANEAPYDAIHVGASCFPVPEELIRQLNLGGRLIVPVKLYDGGEGDEGGQFLVRIDKLQNGSTVSRLLKHVSFAPLTDETKPWTNQIREGFSESKFKDHLRKVKERRKNASTYLEAMCPQRGIYYSVQPTHGLKHLTNNSSVVSSRSLPSFEDRIERK